MNKSILSDKTAIITGANQGLGREISKSFVHNGASVMLCARNFDLLEKTKNEISPLLGDNQKICIKKCDVTDKNDINSLLNETFNTLGGCHILVNNAGIYGPKGPIENTSWQDWKNAFEINFFGSVLMCRALIPHFKKQNYGKIIQLSGGGATKPMPNFSSYASSKAAIVRFIDTLAEEVRDYRININSIAPGALNTKMLQEVLDSGPEKVGLDFYKNAIKQKNNGGVPIKKGVDLVVFLASSASDGISGKLVSAIWDNWDKWPEHLGELEKSDAYTLRRVVGRDRGFDWGDK